MPFQRSPAMPSASWSKWIRPVWFGILVMGILSNPGFESPGRDSGIFLYIGSLILKGKIPYLDVWENKGPLVFYINALGLYLTGGSRWGVWLMEFLFLFIAAWMGYLVLKQTLGDVPALIGTFLWVTAAGNVLQGGNFTEEYALLFGFSASLGYVYSLRQPGKWGPPFLIGLSLGLNILLRPNNVGVQAAIVGAYFVLSVLSRDWRSMFKRLSLIAGGCVAVLIPVISYFALQGALAEMIDIVILFNYQYSQGFDLHRILDGLHSASFSIGIGLVATAVSGLLFFVYLLMRSDALTSLTGKFLLLPVFGWLLDAILSTLSGRNYPHYFIVWAPYLGFLSAYAVHVILRQFRREHERYASLVLLVLLGVTLVTGNHEFREVARVLWHSPASSEGGRDYIHPVASYIHRNTLPGQEVLIWGFRPVINFMSDRESPVSFLPYPLIHVDTPLGYRWADQFYDQITSDPPALIVDMVEPADMERIPVLDPVVRKTQKIKWKSVVLAPNLNDTLDFIHEHYLWVDTVGGFGVYRLKNDLP